MAAPPDTVTDATNRLRESGYDHEADVRDGRVKLRVDGDWTDTGEVDVEQIHRFEGTSDPADEMIVLGVHDHASDRRGVLVAAYGPDTEPDTADCLRALLDDRDSHERVLPD